MEKILQVIAEETHGKSYHTSRIELEAEKPSLQIEYDVDGEVVLKHRGETSPPKKYLSLSSEAEQFALGEQILNYFLDGSRKIFKVGEIAYIFESCKMIYPIVAGQVVAGCCRRTDRRSHEENFCRFVKFARKKSTGQKFYCSCR